MKRSCQVLKERAFEVEGKEYAKARIAKMI